MVVLRFFPHCDVLTESIQKGLTFDGSRKSSLEKGAAFSSFLVSLLIHILISKQRTRSTAKDLSFEHKFELTRKSLSRYPHDTKYSR